MTITGSDQTAQMALVIPKAARLKAVSVNGKRIAAPPEWSTLDRVFILCTTRDCAHASVTLESAATAPFDVTLGERRFGVPQSGRAIVAARPAWAVQSQLGDGTVLLGKVTVR